MDWVESTQSRTPEGTNQSVRGIIAAPVEKKEQNENDCLLVAAVASVNHGSILGAEKLSEWRVV